MTDDWGPYYVEHRCCPKCQNPKITQTLICMGNPVVEDTNRACCHDCDWTGIRHDCVPEKKHA